MKQNLAKPYQLYQTLRNLKKKREITIKVTEVITFNENQND